ncbi:hypothetical protein GQ44DRAFT_708466 [Phaeosphaeriaceae sp. PMI808]|nr:hypothetical protein GQ44DRAFT_708466 [Phaeosphaeriaceae sp. PMI808]
MHLPRPPCISERSRKFYDGTFSISKNGLGFTDDSGGKCALPRIKHGRKTNTRQCIVTLIAAMKQLAHQHLYHPCFLMILSMSVRARTLSFHTPTIALPRLILPHSHQAAQ